MGQLQSRINAQAKITNKILNDIYNQLTEEALSLNGYRLPFHGIPYPEKENPINLFQRQLKIEEMSFELSHNKYKKTLESLIELGRADQLAASHRVIVHWMNCLESAISEQQRISLRKHNLGTNNPALYLLQLPSEKISSLCVIHLMKTLFKSFVSDISHVQNEDAQMYSSYSINTDKVRIPSISLFDELGNIF